MANSTPNQDTCICMFAFEGPPKITNENDYLFTIEISVSLAAVEKYPIRKLSPRVLRINGATFYLHRQAFLDATHDQQDTIIHNLIKGMEIPFELENIHWGFDFPSHETDPGNNLDYVVCNKLSGMARCCAHNDRIGYMNVHIRQLKKLNPDEYQQFCNQEVNKQPLFDWIMENKDNINMYPFIGFIFRLAKESPKDNKFYGLRSKKIMSSVECSICIEDIRVNSQAIAMPCSHTFHGFCIMKWLQRMPNCPLCRYQLFTSKHS